MTEGGVYADSEFGRLRRAVVGHSENYYRLDLRETLRSEMGALREALRGAGVEVLDPTPLVNAPHICDQLTPRDLGVVIGDRLFVCQMREVRRRMEWRSLEPFLRAAGPAVVFLEDEAFIEGGDVLVHGRDVYVGLGERTTEAGIASLGKHIDGDYSVIPVRIDDMHLDLVLNIVGRRVALVNVPRVKKLPPSIVDSFDIVPVSEHDYQLMGVNALGIGDDRVLVARGCDDLARALGRRGLDVLPIPYTAVPQKGGGIRCSVLPLVRERACA